MLSLKNKNMQWRHLGACKFYCCHLYNGAMSADPITFACRYFLQGYCREGNKCRFGHNQHDTGLGFLASQTPTAAHSPFSLAASAQLPSATTLLDPTVAFQTGLAAPPPPPPAPQALADPALSPSYGSAAAFFFDVSRPDSAFPRPGLLQPARLSNLDVGGAGAVFSTGMPGMTAYMPSTPTEASSRIPVEGQPAQKHSPFPGMGAGVSGSSSFKQGV